ncbi:LOW QUALITY PROTEIN: tudor domain-containing protein 7B [Osmerus eperlanus]|uniref:LOW QUALITY PROTEIN: tudor domain-containing protein 7B n=1 Tax=Osmerus eperlanus TaxID=29151 RepID=UPI002E158B9D
MLHPDPIHAVMADVELVKRMLRAVLQTQRGGLQGPRLQAQYKELTGEHIPHRLMGQPSLDALLASMPSVVRMERNRTGEVMYFASDANETAQVAKVMARQRSSKKPGRPLVVDCQMRVKPAAPLVLNAKPRTSLRQPDHRGRGGAGGGEGQGAGRHGDFRQMRDAQPEGKAGQQSTNQNKPSNQNTPTRKSSGSSERSDKRMTLPSRFHKEVHAHLSRNSSQGSPLSNLNESPGSGKGRPHPPSAYNSQEVQGRIQEVLTKYSNGFWVSKLPQMYKELYKEDLPQEALGDLEKWPTICTVEKPCSSNPSELLLYPAKDPPSSPPAVSPPTSSPPAVSPRVSPPTSSPTDKHSPAPRRPPAGSPPPLTPPSCSPGPPGPPASLSPDLEQKLGELLVKYSNGLWAHALPKLFQDTYKTTLPDHVLQNLALLSHFCSVDYPMPDNPKRAILYRRARGGSGGGGGGEEEKRNCTGEEERREEVGRRLSHQAAPPLLLPREEYPSVLVVEASSTNAVILRYIGEGYSQAQETLEDEMREFYRKDNQRRPLTSPASGQLAAVRAEEEDEILRAQVTEVMADKVKVYYVDHGFSEVISKGKVLELHDKFFQLPLQATRCKLAGLEPFCQEPAVLKKFDAMASGKILLAEILEREQTPLVVLYDTSQDDDVNINATCMKALQDRTLASPLQVNSAYMNVTVSSVCSDGTIYCQLRSRGLVKLTDTLDRAEAYFHSQVTSEFLVARPFCGKACLARYKGKWSRVEITNLHGSRVLDILFVDLGVQASVEVFELREIPPPFLKDLVTIPPQAVKCCLSDLVVSVGSWTPEAVQWLRDAVLNSTDCSMKIAKMDDSKRCAHVHLFPDKNFHDPSRSLNHKLATSDLFKHHRDVFLSSHAPSPAAPLHPPTTSTPRTTTTNGSSTTQSSTSKLRRAHSGSGPNPSRGTPPRPRSPPRLPALLEVPQVGQNLDIYVSVACHPGHFVLQPWRDMYKLVILMGEMILYYNKMEETPVRVEKNQVYAAKVENNWHRVLVKGVLTNGLVSVYELDYGKHELVGVAKLRPLIKEFRQLPFQGITAQLAGVKQRQWSEAASIVFRNHVEKKPLVAQLEVVQEAEQPWDRKLTVFLVDTSQEECDVWVHDIMAEFATEP